MNIRPSIHGNKIAAIRQQHFAAADVDGYYAGFITRLIAFLIDIFVIFLLYSGVALILQAIGGFFQRDMFTLLREDAPLGAIAAAAIGLLPVLYYTIFWALVGQTPGKAFMGIRIYTVDGQRLRLRQAFLRYISYWLSTGLLFGGFLLVLADDRRQTLHDKIARTVVVYTWAIPPSANDDGH